MTSTATAVVEFRGASKSYGSVRALSDLTVSVYPGETVALLGPNGAGKSTTLDLLLGLRPPDPGGEVRLFGGTPRQAVVDGRVGAMLQSGALLEGVRVRELVGLASGLQPRGRAVDEILAGAGITEIADRMVDKLSGGQEQRVRFALATAGAADLLVLDEPTTGMDVAARQSFWASMRRESARGRAILFATHYLEEADAIADRVLVLHRGRLLADGTAAEIKTRAGARRISFDLDGPVEEEALRALPACVELELAGRTVRMRSSDADATVHGVYAAGFYPRGLEVTSLGLEQAFLAITEDAERAETTSGGPAGETVRGGGPGRTASGGTGTPGGGSAARGGADSDDEAAVA